MICQMENVLDISGTPYSVQFSAANHLPHSGHGAGGMIPANE